MFVQWINLTLIFSKIGPLLGPFDKITKQLHKKDDIGDSNDFSLQICWDSMNVVAVAMNNGLDSSGAAAPFQPNK